jgi:hypothetical protein
VNYRRKKLIDGALSKFNTCPSKDIKKINQTGGKYLQKVHGHLREI